MDYRSIPLRAIPSPEDKRDYTIARLVATVNVFPDEFEIPYNHEIKNQGTVGSCVAHSLAYCREIIEEKQLNQYNKFSVGFVYANRSASDIQTSGMIPREALQHLLNEGICDYDKFPYNEEYPGILTKFNPIKTDLLVNAAPHRISAYARLYSDDDIRNALMQLGPATACIKIAPSFYRITKQNPVMPYYEQNEPLLGYHEITLVGWANRFGKPCYKALNSWDTEWGEDGYFYIPFDLSMVETWSITDNIVPHPDPLNPKYWRVQVGAYKVKENALKRQAELTAKGFKTYLVQVNGLYKVQCGAFVNRDNANRLAQQLKDAGFSVYTVQY